MNRKRMLCLVGCVACVLLMMSPAPAQQGNNGQSEVQRGFEIAPVRLTMAGKNPSLVGEGSYYVNGISDCVGCHTGANGHMSGDVDFGIVRTRNLTPDSSGKPAGLTLAQFKEVLKIGTDFKGLFPPGPLVIMPWPAYSHGTERYMEAIYEYLKAIPCIEGGPGVPAHRCS